MSQSSSHLGGGAGGGGGLGAAGLDAEDGGAAGSLGGRHGLGDLDAGEGGGSSDHFSCVVVRGQVMNRHARLQGKMLIFSQGKSNQILRCLRGTQRLTLDEVSEIQRLAGKREITFT